MLTSVAPSEPLVAVATDHRRISSGSMSAEQKNLNLNKSDDDDREEEEEEGGSDLGGVGRVLAGRRHDAAARPRRWF